MDSAKILSDGSHMVVEKFGNLGLIIEECFHIQQDLLEVFVKTSILCTILTVHFLIIHLIIVWTMMYQSLLCTYPQLQWHTVQIIIMIIIIECYNLQKYNILSELLTMRQALLPYQEYFMSTNRVPYVGRPSPLIPRKSKDFYIKFKHL